MNNKPNDHHFVPVFYLKQWVSSATKKIIEYSIKHGKFIVKPVGPKGTGFQSGLYSFPELPPELAQHMEDVFLRHSDNNAALALHRILAWDKSAWPPEMIQAWARCIMHLLLRHPDAIAEMRVAAKAIWQSTGVEAQRRYEAEIKQPGHPDTFEEFMLRADPHSISKSLMNTLIRAMDSQAIGEAIIDMNWQVRDLNSSSKTLLTSDRPLLYHNLRGPDGLIALAVSPTKLFLAANSADTFNRLNQRPALALVEMMNAHVVTRARRYVWARDKWQEEYVRRNMGKHKEPAPLFRNLAKLSASK